MSPQKCMRVKRVFKSFPVPRIQTKKTRVRLYTLSAVKCRCSYLKLKPKKKKKKRKVAAPEGAFIYKPADNIRSHFPGSFLLREGDSVFNFQVASRSDSVRTKKSCRGLTVQRLLLQRVRRMQQAGRERREKRGVTTAPSAAAAFCCFWCFRKREKERQKGGWGAKKRAWQLSS